jgi:hypothetical protein
MQKIQFGQREGTREGKINKGGVVIGQLKRESEFLDANGNTINPRTKEIIKRREQQEIE